MYLDYISGLISVDLLFMGGYMDIEYPCILENSNKKRKKKRKKQKREKKSTHSQAFEYSLFHCFSLNSLFCICYSKGFSPAKTVWSSLMALPLSG